MQHEHPSKNLPRPASSREHALLPLGALLLAASSGSWAQPSATPSTPPQAVAQAPLVLTPVVVEGQYERTGKESLKSDTTNIGKGTQALRDVPQSITVVTEKQIDDRNLDTVRDVLRQTAGVTFLAAEGGEEDIRLRGFSLAGTGDIFLDGLRDPAFYERDTFNNERIEVLRGSASMLFGRGSTGGAVNQVSKLPRAINEHEVTATAGNHRYGRVTGDFNLRTGDDAALRINAMATKADNNGSGTSIDKRGLAGAYRFGIGTANEFLASFYWLKNDNGVNYGLPWIRPRTTDTSAANGILQGLDPKNYYGLASDYNHGEARIATLSHIHRFSGDVRLDTRVRKGSFDRDQRASTIRFAAPTDLSTFGPNTVFNRGTPLKVQQVDVLQLQSDLSAKFDALGVRHEVLTGVDFSRESKDVQVARNALQGGVVPAKPPTRAGTPDDGASIDESVRVFRPGNSFVSRAIGIYAQDLIQLTPTWKLLGGVRYDRMRGAFDNFTLPTNAPAPVTTLSYRQNVGEWSKRVGVLWQPSERQSFHFSYGTSFNTSGDAYSYNAQSANTPPESSENIELGARLDSADKRFTNRFALFRSTKTNERNTDPDTAADRLLLSGKRHAAGFEWDFSGRITPEWEVYGSYVWMPIAKVDQAASTATLVGNRVGDRPGLSPKHSGAVWTTYRVTPQWRAGIGVNFRSGQAPADVTAPAWEAPGFATVDLLAEYAINERYLVKANVSNLGNKLYGESLYRGHYVPGAGRLYQMSLTAKF